MQIPQRDFSTLRQKLLERKGDLAHRRELVEHDLERRNEALVADADDQAIQRQNDETLEAIRDAASIEMAGIDAALARIANGGYGFCERCGAPIPVARLEIVPHAVRCADCVED